MNRLCDRAPRYACFLVRTQVFENVELFWRLRDLVTVRSEQNLTAREEYDAWRGGDEVGL